MQARFKLSAALTCLLLISNQTAAHQPLSTRNQHPLVQIVGIPYANDGVVLPVGTWQSSIVFSLANDAVVANSVSEHLVVDGENFALELNVAHVISNGVELGLTLPIVGYSGGFLDSVINDFHHAFGFPEGDRRQFDNDQIHYFYRRDGLVLLEQSQHQSGFGDLRLHAGVGVEAWSNSRRHVSLWGQIKLPTGDSNRLLGSGSFDLSVATALSMDLLLGQPEWSLNSNFGVTLRDSVDVLESISREVVAFGSISTAWAMTDYFAAIIQLDGHTSVYDSVLAELGASTMQLVVGGRWTVSDQLVIDFGFSEDPVEDMTMDITFFAAVHWRQ